MVRETVPSQQQPQPLATIKWIKTTASSPLEKLASECLNQGGVLSQRGYGFRKDEGWTRGARINTPDGPKWTARSETGSRCGTGGGWGRGEQPPLQTALNGRPGVGRANVLGK